MNIQLRFPDNSKLIVPFKVKQKIQSLVSPILQKYPSYLNENAISFNYQYIDTHTLKIANILLDKNKTFLKYKINKNTIIHVQVDMITVFSPPKKKAKVDTLVSNINDNINTKTTNTNQDIIKKLKNMGFSGMDDETINALIDTCKASKGETQVSVEDILEFLT
jgi:hypothetical protein